MADSTLNQKSIELLNEPVVVSFVVAQPDGTLHVTPVWVDVEGNNVVINTAQGRAKARHLDAGSKVAISAIDPKDPFRVTAFHGSILSATTDGADEHVDRLAKKYLGVDSYPNRQPGEVRIKVTITPEKIWMQPS